MMRKLLALLVLCLLVGAVGATELADYGNTSSMYINITPSMGAQTDYQLKFILSNSSGISNYYAPDNVIYTNGTTRADWYDINVTDSADTPLPFWIENNTATAYNATVWVKVPTIAVDNSSGLKWRYGNSSQSGSTMNGSNTFIVFDDFNINTLNTNTWTKSGTQSPSISSGFMTLTSTDSTRDAVFQNVTTAPSALNISARARIKTAHWGTSTPEEYYCDISAFSNPAVGQKYAVWNESWRTIATIPSWSAGTYYVIDNGRYTSQNIVSVINNIYTTDISSVYAASTAQLIMVSVNQNTASIVADWMLTRKHVQVEPTTSLYATSSGGAPAAPVASFTCTPTPTTLGTPISCTDTSSDTPTNWTYYWGDGNVTDGTQNPSYTYPFTGTFSINQTVNNTLGSSWYNRSNYITITNVTSFHQQDIYLTGQYTITFNVKSSTTNLPIANVTVVDAVSGQSYPSTNGTAFLTESAGLIYVNFIADGYQTKQVTYVVDQDETHEVKLVPSASDPTPNTNVIYSPRLVRLRVVDNWRTPLTPVTITASYIADTLPNNDPTYLQNAFGISSTVAGLMMNSSVAMSGVTGVDGSNTFSMFPALTYNITVTNETMGVHCQQDLAPADTDYVLFCPTDAQKAAVIPLSQTLNRSYIWITEPNASYVTINASYQDLTGLTSSVLFNVTVVDNNTVIYSKNFGNPGTSQVLDNYTMPNIRGMQIKSYLAYNRST